MKTFLEKISWKTRRWSYKFNLLELYIHDHDDTWGFSFFTFVLNLKQYSLLRFECRLPNKTSVQRFVVDSWDLLFMTQFLWKHYDNLTDYAMWHRQTTLWQRIQIYILSKIL